MARRKETIPGNAKKLDHNRLAEGEATGHYHEAVGAGVAVFDLGEDKLVLDAGAGAEVTHQEHGTIMLPPGTYDRSIVREYDHAAEEARQVID